MHREEACRSRCSGDVAPCTRTALPTRQRDAVRAAWFRKTRCWKDHKCWVSGCTHPPRRQRNSRRYIVFRDAEGVWKYGCERHSRGLRRVGKVYRAALKRQAQRAAKTLARYGTDDEVDACLAAQLERARREKLPAVARAIIEDGPENVAFLRRLRAGLPV